MANYIKLIPLEIIINRVKNLIKYATPILGEDKIKMIGAITAIDYSTESVEYYNALWHKLRMWLSITHPTLFPIHRYRINRIPSNHRHSWLNKLNNSFYGTYGFQNPTSATESYSTSTITNFHSDGNLWMEDNGTVYQTTFANFNTY